MCARSAPAQKDFPRPARITTLTVLAGGEIAERVREPGDQRIVEGVVSLGPVQRDRGNGAIDPD